MNESRITTADIKEYKEDRGWRDEHSRTTVYENPDGTDFLIPGFLISITMLHYGFEVKYQIAAAPGFLGSQLRFPVQTAIYPKDRIYDFFWINSLISKHHALF